VDRRIAERHLPIQREAPSSRRSEPGAESHPRLPDLKFHPYPVLRIPTKAITFCTCWREPVGPVASPKLQDNFTKIVIFYYILLFFYLHKVRLMVRTIRIELVSLLPPKEVPDVSSFPEHSVSCSWGATFGVVVLVFFSNLYSVQKEPR
jgi:hypothetical protein